MLIIMLSEDRSHVVRDEGYVWQKTKAANKPLGCFTILRADVGLVPVPGNRGGGGGYHAWAQWPVITHWSKSTTQHRDKLEVA